MNKRLFHSLLGLFLFILAMPCLINAQNLIVINELMYNPPPELGDDDYYEYIEITNIGEVAVDLSGWAFTDGIEFTFAQGTIIEPEAFIVIAANPGSIMDYYGIQNVTGPFLGGKLNNGGEIIVLSDAQNLTIDSLEYDDDPPWPVDPDGDGPSLELINPFSNNELYTNWAASMVEFGTPGIVNSVFSHESTITVLSPNGGEFWMNDNIYPIEWTSVNFDQEVKIELFAGSALIEVLEPSTVNDGIWVWDISTNLPLGNDYKIKISNASGGDPYDESDQSFSIMEILPVPNLVISEIMYNPPEVDGDSLEFIEIYNNETYAVNLSGFIFTEGIEYSFPDIAIEPESYLVLAKNSPAILHTFGIQSFQWDDGGLNNSGEELEFRDQFNQVVDYVDYNDGLPWDTLADGYGSSLTLCNTLDDNELPGCWSASTEFVCVNAANDSIFATPGNHCSGIGFPEPKKVAEEIFIYPNPNNGTFTIRLSGLNSALIEIFSINGVTVYSRYIYKNEVRINLPEANKGIYFVKAVDQGNRIVLVERVVVR
ncbi:MAG: lamin tail domain-containing protein [Bacteroidales bacterium]|nr:lamin tail domain-containing protein [Bacteroidales bacterium]